MSDTDLVFPPRPAELDNTKLHPPSVVRAHRQSADQWVATCNEIRTAAERARVAATTPKMLSEDEYYQIRVLEQQRLVEARLEREAQAERDRLVHEQYLAETPPSVTVSATNLYAFAREVTIRTKQGYELDANTVQQVGASFYSIEMRLLPTTKRSGK